MADEHSGPETRSSRTTAELAALRTAIDDLRSSRADDRARIAEAVSELRGMVRSNADTIADLAQQAAAMRSELGDRHGDDDTELVARLDDLDQRVADAAVANDLTTVRQTLAELSVELRSDTERLAEVTDGVQTLADRQRADRERTETRLRTVADHLDQHRKDASGLHDQLQRLAELTGAAREEAATAVADLAGVRDDLVELVKRSDAATEADLAELRHRISDHARAVNALSGKVERHAEQIAKIAQALPNAVGRVEFQAVSERVGSLEGLIETRAREVESSARSRHEQLEEAQRGDRAELLSATVALDGVRHRVSELSEQLEEAAARAQAQRDRILDRLDLHDSRLDDLTHRLAGLEAVLDGFTMAETTVEQRALDMHVKVESLQGQLAAIPTLQTRIDRLETQLEAESGLDRPEVSDRSDRPPTGG